MDTKEKLQFIADAGAIVDKIRQWNREHDTCTPAEKEVLLMIKAELGRLKEVLRKMRDEVKQD